MSKKILLACDLDNTLIHSKKHRMAGDICVEYLNGSEQSYMTPETERLVRAVSREEDILMLPVTTRSVEQYRRIQWADRCTPEFALVCNGTILLRNGEEDTEWKKRSESRVKQYAEEFAEISEICRNQPCFRTVRIVDGMFVFAHFIEGADYGRISRELAERTILDTQISGRKLYFFPEYANKGAAVSEFVHTFRFSGEIIAAGDSTIDISMLDKADKAVVPDSVLAEKLKNPNILVCPENIFFSEFVMRSVIRACTLT